MTRRVFSVVVALLISLLALPISRASADPIVVIAGGSSVIVQNPEGGYNAHLEGTQQFLADLHFGSHNSVCRPCAAGEILNMSKLFLNTQDGFGIVHLAGATYVAAELSQEPNSAIVFLQLFAVPVLFPPSAGASAGLTTHFTAAGDVSGFDGLGFSPLASFNGQGTATLGLVRDPAFHDLWDFASLRYDFTPATPEPATLTLVSGALVGAAIRARKRRDRRTAIQLSTSTPRA